MARTQIVSTQLLLVVLLCAICATVASQSSTPNCRFALSYTLEELWDNPTLQDQFLDDVMYWEGNFAKNYVGLNVHAGLTYDGHGLNYTTGELGQGLLHYWSAASKESIHLMMLAKALQGNTKALRFICNNCTSTDDSLQYTLQIITNKITSYENWNTNFPGFGGFLPWFDVTDEGCVPNSGWTNQVPGLDNGEMVWGIRAVAYELDLIGQTDLAQRYTDYWNLLVSNAMMVFYAGEGRIRAVTLIHDTSVAPYPGNYYENVPCGRNCYLNDPYEGELMAFFMDLYGDWSGIETQREDLWKFKRLKLKSVNYELNTDKGTTSITVQKGWWFSAHEQWKYLELPYFDSEINKRVFFNGERARTWNSASMLYAGMFASVTDVSPPGDEDPAYLSAAGIPSIAFQPVSKFTTVTPYSTFPLFLTGNQTVALTWYLLMLQGPSMQTQFGSTESCNTTGTAISPVLTWDSKITTLCGMLGGISDITREILKQDGKYDEFVWRVNYEWNRVFGDGLQGEDLDFAVPSVTIPYPSTLGDFPSCQAPSSK